MEKSKFWKQTDMAQSGCVVLGRSFHSPVPLLCKLREIGLALTSGLDKAQKNLYIKLKIIMWNKLSVNECWDIAGHRTSDGHWIPVSWEEKPFTVQCSPRPGTVFAYISSFHPLPEPQGNGHRADEWHQDPYSQARKWPRAVWLQSLRTFSLFCLQRTCHGWAVPGTQCGGGGGQNQSCREIWSWNGPWELSQIKSLGEAGPLYPHISLRLYPFLRAIESQRLAVGCTGDCS